MIARPTLPERIQERKLARQALARLLAKSLFEEWLKQHAHELPGGATPSDWYEAPMVNPIKEAGVNP